MKGFVRDSWFFFFFRRFGSADLRSLTCAIDFGASSESA